MEAEILYVEDDNAILILSEKILTREGFSVTSATNYHLALKKIREKEFDLIFLDINLGGKSGLDLLRKIKEKNLKCPVIMITGQPDFDSTLEALRLGAFDYMLKPVEMKNLIHVAKMALEHKALEYEKEKYRTNLEAIFRSVKDAIITVDQKMRVIELNDAAKDICGFSREIIGGKFDTLRQCCSGKCVEILRETIDKKRPIEINRIECKHEKGPNRVVSIETSPLLDGYGTFSGAVTVIKDETRLENLERDLNARQNYHNMIGKSRKLQEIYSLVESLADLQTTVLITGENGTGKELVAEALHYLGSRSGKPLVKVNCAALSENLLESELFGHVKGAFTGAIKDKIGRFQKANGGTILLDEIGDISPRMQSRLLRVLQEMEFERVGDSTPIKVNVRVVAATNRDLYKMVKAGAFRPDLYYRLKVVEINVPPLRKRREDIPLLVDHFVKLYNNRNNRKIITVTPEVMKIFMKYPWPGNIRELKHSIEHASILCQGQFITVDDLPPELKGEAGRKSAEKREIDEAAFIEQALRKTGGNKAKAARLLGISRQTIYRKIKALDITESPTDL